MSLARERFWLIVFVSKTDFLKCGVHGGPFSKTSAGKNRYDGNTVALFIELLVRTRCLSC